MRERRAQATRRRVLESAADLFADRGYEGTTLAAIAKDAGVSIDSVVAVGSKAFLLLESFRLRYVGEGEWRSILDDPGVQSMFTITEAEPALEAAVDFLAVGHAASADLWIVVRSAALTEQVVAAGLEELVALKQESFAATADWLLRTGVLDVPASTPDERRALALELNVVMSAETYLTVTRDWRCSEEEYRQWLRRAIVRARP